MATRKRDTHDPYNVRFESHHAWAEARVTGEAPRMVSATVLDLIRRLDEAKIEAEWDMAATRRSIVFLMRGRLINNNGQTNRYAMEEVTDRSIVFEVMARRAVAHGTEIPARGRPGWPLCTACGQPVDPAALARWNGTTHPTCDPGHADEDGGPDWIEVLPDVAPLKSSHQCRACGRWLEGEWNRARDVVARAEIQRQMDAGRCDDCARRAAQGEV